MQKYYESSNVNDVISIGQKITLFAHLRLPGSCLETNKWDVFYKNAETDATSFKCEFWEGLIPNDENGVWPSTCSCTQFGIEAVQGQPVFTEHERSLFGVANLDWTGWFEVSGIGL